MFDFNNFETVLTSEFPNFATEIAEGSLENYFDEDINQVAGYKGWRVALILKENDRGAYIVPTFSRPQHSFYSTLNVRILINPLNHSNPENKKFKGKKMYLSQILDEKNGWLNDGTFTVKIGFYAESLLDKQGCWRFNFLNVPFEMKSKSHLVDLYRGDTDYRVMCHIQLIKLHCKELYRKMDAKNKIRKIPRFNDMKICLDILHGVQLKYEESTYKNVLKTAKPMEFSNVTRYIELQFIQDPRGDEDIGDRILFAIQSNFNRLLIVFLKELENLSVLKELFVIEDPGDSNFHKLMIGLHKNSNVLKEFLQPYMDGTVYYKKVDIEKMSGESMKICVKKLLYGFE